MGSYGEATKFPLLTRDEWFESEEVSNSKVLIDYFYNIFNIYKLLNLKDDENKKSQPKNRSLKLYLTWWEQAKFDILEVEKEHVDGST